MQIAVAIEALVSAVATRSIHRASGSTDHRLASRQERRGLPMAMRSLVDQPSPLRRPAAQSGHVGLRPRLIDENRTFGIDQALIRSPARPMTACVRTVLLARDKG